MEQKIDFFFRAEPWYDSIAMYLRERREGKSAVAKSIVFEEIGEGLVAEPVLQISYGDAQRMIDSLWGAGLRPTEGAGSAGSLAATEKHLADMRKIAFKKLNISGN